MLPMAEAEQRNSPEELDDSRNLSRKMAVMVLLFAGFALIGFFSPLRKMWSVAEGVEFILNLGYWGTVVVVLSGTLAQLAFFPRWPFAVLSGLLYGPLWGSILGNVTCTLGAWLQFVLARGVMRDTTARILERRGRRLPDVTGGRAVMILLGMRLFPISSYSVTNLLATMLNISHFTFAGVTFIASIPATVMYAIWGGMLFQPTPTMIGIAVVLLLVIFLAAWLLRRYRQDEKTATT